MMLINATVKKIITAAIKIFDVLSNSFLSIIDGVLNIGY